MGHLVGATHLHPEADLDAAPGPTSPLRMNGV